MPAGWRKGVWNPPASHSRTLVTMEGGLWALQLPPPRRDRCQPGQVSSMTKQDAWRAVPIPAGQAGYLIATAARAPSVQNTQPWRVRGGEDGIEPYTGPRRKPRGERGGREG